MCNYIYIVYIHELIAYCIQVTIRHCFIFSPLPSLSAGQFNTGQIPMSQIISYNTTLSGQIQDWVKPFASEKGENNTGAKITPYTVVELFLLSFP